jgi:hypothetical protein
MRLRQQVALDTLVANDLATINSVIFSSLFF